MKNKTFKRFICFLLALIVMVSLPLDLQANAVAIELGWMTWVLVSAMTAMGFTFAASGGIEALQSAVEDAVDEYDEYRQTIGFNNGLYDVLDEKLLFGGGGGQGPNLGNRFWLTAGGVAAVAEFVQWVRENLWVRGQEITSELRNVSFNASSLITYPTIVEELVAIGKVFNILSVGDIIPATDNSIYPTGQENHIYIYGSGGATIVDIYWKNKDSGYVNVAWDVYDLEGNKVDHEYIQVSDKFLGFTLIVYNEPNSGIVGLSRVSLDGTISRVSDMPKFYDLGQYGVFQTEILTESIITSPFEVTEYEVQENEVLELDFSVFENQEFNSPEEMADAIKNNIIDTGTVPQITPDIIVDPSTLPPPTPVPTPVPTPEVEDIDDLGLPTLGEAIFNKFPFSLPKDLKRIADILNAEPVTPFWEVNLFETLGNRVPFVDDTTIRIDLAEYEALGQISRWASVITFVIFLVIITKGVIRW